MISFLEVLFYFTSCIPQLVFNKLKALDEQQVNFVSATCHGHPMEQASAQTHASAPVCAPAALALGSIGSVALGPGEVAWGFATVPISQKTLGPSLTKATSTGVSALFLR